MASSAVIYGATLTNATFGSVSPGGSWDEGWVQSSELEQLIENERVRDNAGRFIGGAKYGPSNGFNFTYISKAASHGDFALITGSSTLTVDINGTDKDFIMENLRQSSTNTGFLTFTGTAFYSDDFTT